MQGGAEGEGGVRVDGVVTLIDQADDALLINDDVGAQRPLVVFVFDIVGFQNAVRGEHLAVHVAEQRKVEAVLLGEGGVGGGTIHADAEDGSVFRGNAAGVNAGLDGAHLLGAALGKGKDVDGQENVLFAAVVAELDGFPLVSEQSEIRRGIADFERHVGHTAGPVNLMSERKSRRGGNQEQTGNNSAFHHVDRPIKPNPKG